MNTSSARGTPAVGVVVGVDVGGALVGLAAVAVPAEIVVAGVVNAAGAGSFGALHAPSAAVTRT